MDARVADADCLAAYAGKFAMALVGLSLKRSLHFVIGWPYRSCLLASSDEALAASALQEFKLLRDDYAELEKQPGGEVEHLRERSIFRLVSVQQIAW